MPSKARCTTFDELIRSEILEIGDGYRAKNSELGGDGPVFLRAGLVADSGIDLDGAERFQAKLADRVANKSSRIGDTIVTTKGNSTGRTAYIAFSAPSVVYSPHLSYWRSRNAAKLDPRFLRYWARGDEFGDQLEGMSHSTDMAPYLSLADQRRLQITLPEPEEQAAIGEMLGALDDRIDLNRRTTCTLEEMASALFRSWFVDFDPVVAKAAGRAPFGMDAATAAPFPSAFEDSELGLIPKGWRVAPIDSVADFLNGLPLQRYPPDGGASLPVIKIAQLRAGTADGSDLANIKVPREYVIDDGDLIFSWSGSLLVELWCGGRGALNQHLFKVTSAACPKWFCFHWLRHHLPEFQGIAADKATTMGHIRRHHLSDALVLVPPADVLVAMDAMMAPLLDFHVHKGVESRTLGALRDSLLPRLLSGEICLRDVERLVGTRT